MSDPSLSFNQAVKGIAEFIEVAIHAILYIRQIYPPDLFVRRRKYDMPVFQSRHPALNEYISGAVKAIADELVSGNVLRVIVAIKDKHQVVLERFIFSVQNMIEVEPHDRDVSVQEAMSSATLSRYLRAFLLKLSMMESQLGTLESQDEASFAILLELCDDRDTPAGPQDEVNQDLPAWVPADKQLTTAATPDDAQLYFLRAVETGIVNLSLAVQESEEKLRRLKDPNKSGDVSQNGRENGKQEIVPPPSPLKSIPATSAAVEETR